jgi:hypothetical protein
MTSILAIGIVQHGVAAFWGASAGLIYLNFHFPGRDCHDP